MRTEGSMPLGEDLPSESSIAAFCRRRGISNLKPAAASSEAHSAPASPTIGTSRRALLLATDIAGVPCFPDMEGELPASPPVLPLLHLLLTCLRMTCHYLRYLYHSLSPQLLLQEIPSIWPTWIVSLSPCLVVDQPRPIVIYSPFLISVCVIVSR